MESIGSYFCIHMLFISTLYNTTTTSQATPLQTKWQLLGVNNNSIFHPEDLLPKKILSSLYYDIGKFCKNNGLNYLTISNLPYLADMESTLNVMKSILYHDMMFRYLDFDDIQQPKNYLNNQDSLLLLTNSDILLQNNEQNYFQKCSSLITKVSKLKRAIIVFTTQLSFEQEKSLDMKINVITENSLFYIAYQDFANLVRVKSIVRFESFYHPTHFSKGFSKNYDC